MPYGFDVSSGFRFLSGVPIDATFGRDINNSRGGADRPFSGPGLPFARNGFRNEPFKDVNFRVQWGLDFAGIAQDDRDRRLLQYLQLGQHPADRHRGDQLLRWNGAGRLRVRRPDESELPVAD